MERVTVHPEYGGFTGLNLSKWGVYRPEFFNDSCSGKFDFEVGSIDAPDMIVCGSMKVVKNSKGEEEFAAPRITHRTNWL